MKRILHQSKAIAISECLRMATSPAWAILLFLWTLVCALFFQIVINYAASNALPAGETPMSYFFRTAPFLLPLLLIVFVPQLTMDVVAGRRERGRMEQLLISGLKPSALIIGSYFAICLLIALLLIPPLLFHLVVAMHAAPDFGKTLSALMNLYVIGAAIAALGLAVSCWTPSRLSAGLLAVSIGIAWWIIDVFGQQIDQTDEWLLLRNAFAMAMSIYDSASGQLDPRVIIGFILLTVAFLFIARCGLDAKRFPRSRIISAAAFSLVTIVFINHLQSWNARWDLTSQGQHSITAETQETALDLINNGGLHITLASTPHMRSDPLDAPVYERCRHMLKRLENIGLRFNEMDPALDPNGTLQLSRECDIQPKDWKHPLLILRYLNQYSVLRMKDLAIYEARDNNLQLQALRCEGALLAGMQFLKKGRNIHIAWLENNDTRPVNTELLHHRNQSMQSALQRLKSDGYIVHVIKDISEANDTFDALVIPGVKNDITEQQRIFLQNLITSGTSIFIILDKPGLTHLSHLLTDYGINTINGPLAQIIDSEQKLIATQFNVQLQDESEPFGLLYREQLQLYLNKSHGLSINNKQSLTHRTKGFFHSSDPIINTQGKPQNTPCFIGIAHSIDKKHGSMVAFANAAALSDEHLHKQANNQIFSVLTRYLSKHEIINSMSPEPVSAKRFTLSSQQRLILTWCIGIGLPLLSALLGAFVAWRRRRFA